MVHLDFNTKLILLLLIIFPKVSLASINNSADMCFDEKTQYSVNLCLTHTLKNSMLKYEKARKNFTDFVSGGIENSQKFKKLEKKSNKNWLSSIDNDCEMIAFKSGAEDSPLYNSEYTYCMLNKYNERIDFFKHNHHL